MNVAIFASGGGSNFRALLEHADRGDLPGAAFVLLVTNNSGCGAARYARERGMAVEHVSAVTHPSEGERGRHLLALLESAGVDLIALAGYMKLLPPGVIDRYSGAILNIHPALLPRFGGQGMYGIHVHEAVLAAGEKETGVTVHLVTHRYDEGEILAQERVPVLAGDTPEELQKRVLVVEHGLYWRVLRRFAERGRGAAPGTVRAPPREA
jgi:phosphoribosylglycinamide formyltransferase-1